MSYALALSHFHCCFRSGCSDTSWCCQCSADECFVRLEFRCHGGRQQFSRALRRCFVYHLAAANNRNDREADRFDTRTHIRVLSVCPEFRQNCVLHELHCHHAWVYYSFVIGTKSMFCCTSMQDVPVRCPAENKIVVSNGLTAFCRDSVVKDLTDSVRWLSVLAEKDSQSHNQECSGKFWFEGTVSET